MAKSSSRFGYHAISLCVWTYATSARAECAAPFVHTYEVQGSADVSPLIGQTVTVTAAVTADFLGLPGSVGALDGVFVQDALGDEDPRTSDALFLYFDAASRAPWAVAFEPGTHLSAQGVVEEYEGETQLRIQSVEFCGEAEIPTPIELDWPLESAHQGGQGWVGSLEQLEGMLVTTAAPLRVADLGAYARFGELTLVHGALPWSFTHDNLPDLVAFDGYERAIALRTLVLDDGLDTRPTRSLEQSVRIGSAWKPGSVFVVRPPRSGAEGSQAAYRALALTPPIWAPPEPDTMSPSVPEAGTVRVVAANLHNLFEDGGESAACYPSFTADDCRGETTAMARREHLENSARAAARWGADVIAVSEVQNDFGAGGEPTWVGWVEALNLAAGESGARCWRYAPVVPSDYHGGDAIAVALAYCTETLELVSHAAPSSEQISAWGPGVFTGVNASRLPLAGTFARLGDERSFTVVANHFKSRSPGALTEQCPNPRLPDCDPGDGQGYFNDARARAATAVVQWLLRAAGAEPMVLVGDLNSYRLEQPLSVLENSGYLTLTGPVMERPTYAYGARLGVIDHVLISREHAPLVSRVGVFSGNVGVAPELTFSDHDPVFVDLVLDVAPSCDCAAPGAIVGTPGDDVLWGSSGDDVLCGLGGDDILFGMGGSDCASGGLGDDWIFVQTRSDLGGVAEGEHRVFGSGPEECNL